MRRSYFQCSSHNHQQAFPAEDHRKEEMRSEKRNSAIIAMASSNGDDHEKTEAPAVADTSLKKLERKPTDTEDINASAEAFIKNFRHQLLIQRLQSIENYEQMLARGL